MSVCFLRVQKLRALVELVGPMGVDIIDADLLSYVNSHMRDIRVFLATNSEVSRHHTKKCDVCVSGDSPYIVIFREVSVVVPRRSLACDILYCLS
jgi:hypothetical protein